MDDFIQAICRCNTNASSKSWKRNAKIGIDIKKALGTALTLLCLMINGQNICLPLQHGCLHEVFRKYGTHVCAPFLH